MNEYDDSVPPTSKQDKDVNISRGESEDSPAPSKTPLYQAMHSDRYMRQMLIKHIQKKYGGRLICFVCGIAAGIHRDDTLGFADCVFR